MFRWIPWLPVNMPPKDSPLRQAFSRHPYPDRQEWLKSYVEDGLEDNQTIFEEMARAGFRHEIGREGDDRFYWRGRPTGSLFHEVMIVNIIGSEVETNCGAIAP